MRRIIFIWIAIQVILTAAVYGQDDSSRAEPPTVQAPEVQDSLTPKPVRKKPVPVKQIKQEPVPVHINIDSVPKLTPNISSAHALYGNAMLPFITGHPYYSVSNDVVYMPSKWHTPESKDELFYIFCATLFSWGY